MNLSRNRACFWSAVACLLLTFALRADADPLILHAHEREKAGDFEASTALLSRWLALNPGASGSPEVFADYFRMEMDLHALLEVSRQFLVSAKGVPGAAYQFYRVARLLDLSGRIEEARNAYLAAFSEGFSESALVAAFLLSCQMNDARSMEESLQKLAGKRRKRGNPAASSFRHADWRAGSGPLCTDRGCRSNRKPRACAQGALDPVPDGCQAWEHCLRVFVPFQARISIFLRAGNGYRSGPGCARREDSPRSCRGNADAWPVRSRSIASQPRSRPGSCAGSIGTRRVLAGGLGGASGPDSTSGSARLRHTDCTAKHGCASSAGDLAGSRPGGQGLGPGGLISHE